MKTYIGNDRCTRCGGGSSPCPVCNPVEEPPRELKLAFDLPLSKQLRGRISREDGIMLDVLNEARKVLLTGGCLGGTKNGTIERQILLRTKRCIWQHENL